MHRHPLGATSLHVTPIGIGLAALGRPGYINLGHADDLGHSYDVAAMEAHTHAVLDAAWQAGIRYFDAARSYGKAEQFLGTWLRARQIDPTAVAVGSKWGYTYTADWQVEAEQHEVKEHSLAVLQRQWEETGSHLAAYLRLYQIHSATLDSGVLDNRAVLTELARLKQQGLHIGLSTSGAAQSDTIERALAVTVDGLPLFDTFQVTWNMLEQSTTPALHAAQQAGVGVIIKEALANGRLTPRGGDTLDDARRSLLRQETARLGCTVDALALAAVLAQPWAGVVLSGAATIKQLASNVAALDVAWDAEATALLGRLAEPAADYWQTRKRLPWN
jgi:aryl-alcohol dehydrogenase-like predicted oxidoreductase